MQEPGEQTTEIGDRQLVAAACQGSESAFCVLFERYSERLWGLARSLSGGDFDETQDLIQETFVRAFSRLHTLESAESLGAWLATAMRRRAYSRMAANRRRTALLETVDDATILGAPIPTPEQEFLSARARDDLLAATERLTAQSRQIFSAFHLQGLPIARISEETGISVGAVKARLFHSRKDRPSLHRGHGAGSGAQ
jgi:RNA polymerase sigma-70 factor, ECF subfamily